MPTRDDAYHFMTTHVKNENLQKHMLAVEAAMRFYAPKFGEDEELWGMTGLLHDCDYEKFPDLREHTLISAGWLREDGYDERIIYAILAHNDLNIATHPRNNPLSHALYACDEITGMITATASHRPLIQHTYYPAYQCEKLYSLALTPWSTARNTPVLACLDAQNCYLQRI
jgi:putative nucleotidyltransferase with HDIG domain